MWKTYKCETPKEYLDVAICTFTDDCGENEGGYYVQFAIIDTRDDYELTDWVDDCVVHKEDLVGSDDEYELAHKIATDYMLSVKEGLIDDYFNNKLHM